MSEFVIENQSEYQIIKAEIRSDRADVGIDIKIGEYLDEKETV